jgi:hypothetical protein
LIGPAILISHGPRGERAATRTEALARPRGIVIHAAVDAFGEAARELAAKVPGQALVDVIHFVDPAEAGLDRLSPAMAAIGEEAADLPALHFQQWVIALVGEEWDDHELGLSHAAGPGTPGAGLLVLGRSSEARGLLSDSDEVAMASDVAYAVLSTDLRSVFSTSPWWTAGSTTVIYRRRLLVAALAAYYAGRSLDDPLLAPLAAVQPFGVTGHLWPGQEHLGDDRHHELLSRGPLGGSAFSDLAVSDNVFADTPLELLSDALQSYFEQLAVGMLSRVKAQVDRNQDEHLAHTQAELSAAAVETLRSSANFASTRDFLDNVIAGLAEIVHDLLVRIAEAEHALPTDHERVQRELERAIRKLPYPAAIAARGAGFASLGILGYLLLQEPMGWPSTDTPVGAGVGAVLALIIYIWYRFGVARIQKLRRRYLRAIEKRLRAEAELYALQCSLAEITALQEFAGTGPDGLSTRLDSLRAQVQGVRDSYAQRVTDRAWGNLTPTTYSIFVPATDDVSTEALSRQFPLPPGVDLTGTVLGAVVPGPGLDPIDPQRFDDVVVDAVAAQIEHALWPSLEALLADAPASQERVADVLSTPASPLLRRSDFVPQQDDVRRFLFVDTTRARTITDSIGTAVDYDGTRPTDDPDTLILIALRDASAVRPSGGRDASA